MTFELKGPISDGGQVVEEMRRRVRGKRGTMGRSAALAVNCELLRAAGAPTSNPKICSDAL